jgi:hypothetical protein
MSNEGAERYAAQEHAKRVRELGDHVAEEWESMAAQTLPDGFGISARERVLALMLDTFRWGRSLDGRPKDAPTAYELYEARNLALTVPGAGLFVTDAVLAERTREALALLGFYAVHQDRPDGEVLAANLGALRAVVAALSDALGPDKLPLLTAGTSAAWRALIAATAEDPDGDPGH